MIKRKNWIGHKFGWWTVITNAPDKISATGIHRRCLHVKCKCGVEKDLTITDLRSGDSTSCGCKQKMAPGYAALRMLFKNYRDKKPARTLGFDLSIEQFKSITSKDCFYCGVAPAQKISSASGSKDRTYIYNGIDRKDSKVGYWMSNCVPCCWLCNRSKNNLSARAFLAWVKKLYKYNWGKE